MTFAGISTTLRLWVLPFGALGVAAIGLGFYAANQPWPPPSALGAWFYPLAMLFMLGAAETVGRTAGHRPHFHALLEGSRIAWPAALLIALVAFANPKTTIAGGYLTTIIVVISLMTLALRFNLRRAHQASFVPVVPWRSPKAWPGLWELGLLGISIAIGTIYLRIGAQAQGNFQNDSAYYFGVARHIAISGRIEEPLVWHFANPPETIVHAPFDYWGGLTSLLLAPVLAFFGATQRVAFIAMATINASTIIAFWYLVCFALPIRQPIIQLVTLSSFAFSPFAIYYRFDTESLSVYHFALVMALIAIAQKRSRLAVVAGFCLALTRVDGMLLYVGICGAMLLGSWRRHARDDARRIAVLAVGLLIAYVARNLWSFGTPMPPGAAMGPLLDHEQDLYAWKDHAPSVVTTLQSRLQPDYLLARINLLAQAIHNLSMLPAQPFFLILGAAPVLGVWRKGHRGQLLLPIVTVFVLYAFTWGSGPVFHSWRTLSALLPLVVVTCGMGASSLYDFIFAVGRRLQLQSRRGRMWRATIVIVTSILAFAIILPVARAISPYGLRPRAVGWNYENQFSQQSNRFDRAPLMTNSPWQIMAHTHSPTVSIPVNGAHAVAAVMHKYGVKWLVLVGTGAYPGASGPVIQAIRRGKTNAIPGFRVELVHQNAMLSMFRLVQDSPNPPALP